MSRLVEIRPLPPALCQVAEGLAAIGRDAWLVGESLHDWLLGSTPDVWSLATGASAGEIAGRFPSAVPIRAASVTLALPTRAGPLHITPHRNGARVEDDLAHRDFRVLAMALEPGSGQLRDPYDGRTDLERARLRAVGDAEQRLREEPLRLLRAARLVATRGYEAAPELVRALAEEASSAAGISAADSRRELTRLLLGADARAGLELLRRTGIEPALVPGVAEGAAAWVQSLPQRLDLRLAAWLRGAHPGQALHRLRFDPELSERVLRLLQLHPIEQNVSPRRHTSLRRLLERVPADEIEALFVLRECEFARQGSPPAPLEALAALRGALVRVSEQIEQARRRPALALAGEQVMAILGSGPGPQVGRALRFLRQRIDVDPGCNEPEALTDLLRAWAAEHGDPRP